MCAQITSRSFLEKAEGYLAALEQLVEHRDGMTYDPIRLIIKDGECRLVSRNGHVYKRFTS